MRLLRQAIAQVWSALEEARSNLRDNAAFEFITELQVDLMDKLAKLQQQGRQVLVIHGVALPFHHPIATVIMSCANCHAAVSAQVEVDNRPGEYEDAYLDACPNHIQAVNQYARDEVILREMREHGEQLAERLVEHMQGIHHAQGCASCRGTQPCLCGDKEVF